VQVSIEPAEGGPRRPLRFRPYAFLRQAAYVIPAHHPVCAVCGELYPCKHLEIDEAATGALAELADLESVLPGCCWHCREPISGRQKFISFPGDNLLLPGGPPPAFHLRAGKPWCSSAARLYERRWVEADPARLPRLQCPGRLTRHVDGHECTAGARCPGAAADHPSQSNHTANAAYARDCGRCAAAVARRGATLPGGLS
jgi:hypothetical protein